MPRCCCCLISLTLIFKSTYTPSRITATMLATPIPFGMALAGQAYGFLQRQWC